MSSRNAFRGLCSLLVLLLLVGSITMLPERSKAYDYAAVQFKVVDADTGEPAVGAKYSFYSKSSYDGKVHSGAFGDVGPGGTVSVRIGGGESVWLYVDGGSAYYDGICGGVEPTAEISPNSRMTWPDPVDAAYFSGSPSYFTPTGKSTVLPTVSLRPRPLSYGGVVGRVTDAAGAAQRNGLVWVYKYDPFSGTWAKTSLWVQPAGDGVFRLLGTQQVPLVGDVRIAFDGLGLPGGWFTGDAALTNARTLHLSSPSSWTHGVDVRVPALRAVAGEVYWAPTKQPPDSAQVEVDSATGNGGFSDASPDTGAWYVRDIAADLYTIRAFITGGSSPKMTYYGQAASAAASTKVTLPASGLVDELDFWLSDRPALAGKVRSPEGEPLADVLVTAYRLTDGEWGAVGSDYTDAGGRYALVCPSYGTYAIRFTDTAGTSGGIDDVHTYLGGADSIDSATRLKVSSTIPVVRDVSIALRPGSRAYRVTGENQCDRALALAKSTRADGSARDVVLASSDEASSAACATTLSTALGAPMLVTPRGGLYPGIVAELDRLGTRVVHVVGGSGAISPAQEGLLRALGFEVRRYGGSDAAEVSVNVAAAVHDAYGTTDAPVFVVGAGDTMDAIATAAAACAAKGTLLIVKPTARAAVATVDEPRHVVVVGSAAALPDSAVRASVSTLDLTRCVTGTDAYANAGAIANFARSNGWVSDGSVGLARLTSPGDGVVGVIDLVRSQGVLLFSGRVSLPNATLDAIGRSALNRRVAVYADSSAIVPEVLVQAGSAKRPVTVGTPSAPSTMYHKRTYSLTGYLTPRRVAGTSPIRVYKWRYVHGHWKSYGYVTARLSDSGSRSKYTARVSVPYSGRWRFRAYHVSDPVFASGWSTSYRYRTVR